MKLISWNVNGIRACIKKGFIEVIKKENPDIICLQETKANQEQGDPKLEGYEQYWNSAEKAGYAGTVVFTKIKPISVAYDDEKINHKGEGRVITLEFKDFFLVNVYTINSQRGLTRLKLRQEWDKYFLKYMKELEQKKSVIFCGDLNVAHEEKDIARPKDNRKNAGFTDEERTGFSDYITAGFIDTFREFNKEGGNYTWWLQMFNARARNIGWRIDYFLISKKLKEKLESAFILKDIMGSDHCPVGIIINP